MAEYYELTKVTEPDELKPGEFRILTAAILECSLCGGMIDGMGGPGNGAVCLKCAELMMNGQARGAIIWEET